MSDELEAIRARHEQTGRGWAIGNWFTEDGEKAHADRATLLKEHDRQQYAIQIKNSQIEELEELLDAAREELREVKEAAVISIPTDLAKLVINIGVAEWGSTHAETADGHADHVRESVRKTA